MEMSRFPYCKEYLISWVSCIPCCNCVNRRERAFARARDKLEKEMCIMEYIKKQRYVTKALKKLIPPMERLALKEKTRYLIVDPDKDSSDGGGATDEEVDGP